MHPNTARAWLLLCLAAGPAAPAWASEHPVLSSHVPEIVAAHRAVPAGRPDPAAHMILAVSLPQRNQSALVALLGTLYDPASPQYRRYLSVADFTDRFGPTAADYEAARAFFADRGLTILATAANRGLLTMEGSVADIEQVFHVTLGLYRHPTEQRLFVAPDREPALDLAVPLLHVTGLDDLDPARPRLLRRRAEAGPRPGTGPDGSLIGSDVRTAYASPTRLTGAGQAVGLMELGGYALSDVEAYFSTLNQPFHVPIVGISTDGANVGCPAKCHDGEQALDIEYAVSMAPGLSQVQVYVGHSPEAVLNRMASDNTSQQLSTSWGWSTREYPTDHPIFLEMAAQGQTLLTASGDDSSLKASDPWPEEDAFITAVGGTDLAVSPNGAWLHETGWSYSAGGPALGGMFPIQNYQLPFVNTGNGGSHRRRNVPDVAGDADTDNYICFDGKCEGGWGGTSFASPLWAGFIALANQQAALRHQPPVGFINPLLYALGGRANYDWLFHDEVRGRSGLYSATFSYDLVTGLGSPRPGLIGALVGTND